MSSKNFVKSIIGKSNKKPEKVQSYVTLQTDWKFSLARIMLTGVFKNQYYRSADAAIEEAKKLAPMAAKTDPSFLLKAACFARDANMKSMVLIGAAALNGYADDAFLARPANRKAIVGLLSTFGPNQLLQFIELVKSKVFGRGLGTRPQKWVRTVVENWKAEKLEEYTLKYPSSLYDIVRIIHPRFTAEKAGIISYLLKDKKVENFGERQNVVEKIKKMTNPTKVASLVLDNNIPWDVIKGIGLVHNEDLHLAEMVQMGLSALLLNMRSFESKGIFKTPRGLKALELKMDEVKNGRSIPLDFAKPYIHCSDDGVKKILLDAMADTLSVPMPSLEGKEIGLSIDISGSMHGETLKTSGLLATSFLKAKNLWITTFDTHLYSEGTSYCPQINGLPPRDQVKALLSLRTNGGTDVAISLRDAIAKKRKLDLMIIVTDEQQNSGTPLMTQWRQYKKLFPKAELWIINATNYEWTAVDYGDPSVVVYQSLTPAIFKNIEFAGMDIVSAIEEYDLGQTRKRSEVRVQESV